VVFPAVATAKLEWLVHGRRREFQFSQGDAIINPAGLFTAPRWNTELEIVLVGIDPHFINRAAEQLGSRPRVDLAPQFRFRDPLLEQLASALIQEFERKDLPPDHLYAESLASAFVAHLLKKYSVAGVRELTVRGGLRAYRLRHIIEHINAKLGAKITIETMADLAGLRPLISSRSSSSQLVFRRINTSPREDSNKRSPC
jgi:AraC family transcriptional regulator